MFTVLLIIAVTVLALCIGPIRLAIFVIEACTVLFFFGVLLVIVTSIA